MPYLLLFQSKNPIIGPVAQLMGKILNIIYNGLYSVFHIDNLAVSIVVFTIIIKLLLVLLAVKQQKAMKATQKLQQEIKIINEN